MPRQIKIDDGAGNYTVLTNEYPSFADQLDDIFHNGLDGWKATIQETKDKYPKP